MSSRLLGLIRPFLFNGDCERRPATPPVRVIPGGNAAPELGMLCRDGDFAAFEEAPGKFWVDPKIDGLRAIYIDGVIVSREGVPLRCALHCQPALRRLEAAYGEPMVFDGEYVADGGFAATLAEHAKGEGCGVLWLFDALPLRLWRKGGDETPLVERRRQLMANIGAVESAFVGTMAGWVMTGEQAVAKASELWAHGMEGIVKKRLDSPYVRARSNDWRRLKQTLAEDAPVTDVVIRDGRLKAVICRTAAGNVKFTRGWTGPEEAVLIYRFTTDSHLRTEANGQALIDAMRNFAAAQGRPFTSEDTPTAAPVARISYQLSTGDKRTVRGAVFHNLI